MREVATALTIIFCLLFLPILLLMNATPGLKKFPQWLNNHVLEYRGEVSMPLIIIYFFLFSFILALIVNPGQFSSPHSHHGDWDMTMDDQNCDGRHPC